MKKILFIFLFLFNAKLLYADIPHFIDFKYILNESNAGKGAQKTLKTKLENGLKSLKEKEQTYGPKRRASDLLERYVGQQVDQSQLLGYTQALTNQDIAAMSETNRQRLETNLAFDRDSPTRMQERQLKAKTGEALLAEAVAKQATSAAQIGGLGTARTYGSGRVN